MKNKSVVITKKARENMVKARAGFQTLPKIVGMAFGSGGVSDDGNVVVPNENQEVLNHELYRKNIDSYSFPSDTTCRYVCTLEEGEMTGEDISEIGLYDENGDIMCIKNFTKKCKDDDLEMTFTLDDIF